MQSAHFENSNMLHLSVIKPLLGALGWLVLAMAYTTGAWQWLAENNRSLAGLAAALNIAWGAYRATVWARRAIHRKRHGDVYLSEKKRWWLK